MNLRNPTLWSVLPLLTVTVVNFVSVPLFYRYLGSDRYALWLYVLTFTGAFGFMDLGLGVAVGRYLGIALGQNDREAVRQYWGTGNAIAIPLLVVMAGIFAIVGVTAGTRWFHVAPADVGLLRLAFVAAGLNIFLSYYSQFWLILSQTHLDFQFLGILRTIVSLLQIVPAIPLAWATRSPLVLILWQSAVAAVQLAVFIVHARKYYNIGLEFSSARTSRGKEMSSFVGKTFLNLLVQSIVGSTDRITLGRLAPAVDFTHYAIAMNVGSRLQGLSQAVMGPVFSHSVRSIGRGDKAGLVSIYNQTFRGTFSVCSFVALWVAVWHPIVLRLWLGPELGAAISPIISPVIAGCCLTAISLVSTAQLGPLDRVGAGIGYILLTGFLLAVGVWVGWSYAGLQGVAWGFFFSRVGFIAQDLFVIRLIKAGGWLAKNTWTELLFQTGIAIGFFAVYLVIGTDSYWNIGPAILHGVVVGVWWLKNGFNGGTAPVSGPGAPEVPILERIG